MKVEHLGDLNMYERNILTWILDKQRGQWQVDKTRFGREKLQTLNL